jgi:serine protease inhibitor
MYLQRDWLRSISERLAVVEFSFLWALGLALSFHIGGDSVAHGQEPEQDLNLVSAEAAFAFNLMQLGRPGDSGNERNIISSPAGIYQALAALALASSGDTRDELLELLGLRGNELSMESAPALDWTKGQRASPQFEYRTDVSLEENSGYGLRVSEEPGERSYGQIAGLHRGDLIFRVDGLVMRKLEDFENACRTSSGKVILEGYEYDLGETFSNRSLGLRKFLAESVGKESAFQSVNLGVFHEDLNPSERFLAAAYRSLGFRATKLTPLGEKGFSSPEFKKWFRQAAGSNFGDFDQNFINLEGVRFLILNLARFESVWGSASKSLGEKPFRGFSGEMQASFFELEGECFKLLEFDLLSHVVVPLKALGYEFRIVLPRDEGEEAFAQIRQRLSEAAVQKSLSPAQSTPVALRVAIPCFAFSSELDRTRLQQVFKLENTFSRQAEFPEFSSTVMLGDLAQRAKVVVDARGVFAESATGAVGVPKSLPQNFRAITIDRPFFFQIVRSDGLVLFQGQVVDPHAVIERSSKE